MKNLLFNSVEYLFIFIPVVFVLYFALNKLKLYNFAKIFLLIASLYFYGTYKLEYVGIIICSILFNYYISKLFKYDINKNTKKAILIFNLFINIIILFFFKYFNSIIEILNNFSYTNFNTLKILVPLGISFFTLQQISYVIDTYKDSIKKYNILDYALFVCFFPQLIAGPIVRHEEMIPQFRNLKNRIINQNNIFIGIFLITIGLLKKVIFADEFANYINYIVTNEIYTDFYMSWILCIAKVLNIYFDFSGYCDIALGSSALFNIKLPWNFNAPFQAINVDDFWKRNNMTLIRFLKDYIYKPLEKKFKSKFGKNFNIIFTFSILGIWMGFNIVTVFYGFINGIYVCFNKWWTKLNIKMPIITAKFLTFIFIVLSSPFLFENNISNLIKVLKSMLGINATFTKFVVEDYYFKFMLMPPHNAQINIVILIFAFIIIFFIPGSNVLALIYSKKNNTFYTFLLSLIFIYVVMSITKSNSFVYFDF